MTRKKGLKLHVHDERDLLLGKYLDTTKLPEPPETFTFAEVVGRDDWGMLLNDRLGSCAPAEAIHSQRVLGILGGHEPTFNDACCEKAYEEMGGYDPSQENPDTGENPTDQGCDLRTVAKVWQKVGLPDVSGHRHHCGAYLWLEPGNLTELKIATNLFKAGMLGYRLTQNAEEASEEADQQGTTPVWNYDASSPEVGGHAVPEFGTPEAGLWDGVSWGELTRVADDYIANQMDSGFVVLSGSIFGEDGEIDGFDHEMLAADMKQLGIEH